MHGSALIQSVCLVAAVHINPSTLSSLELHLQGDVYPRKVYPHPLTPQRLFLGGFVITCSCVVNLETVFNTIGLMALKEQVTERVNV